jgi:hypothetical protein
MADGQKLHDGPEINASIRDEANTADNVNAARAFRK